MMRLYLLPISTRRTLLYAQRLNVAATNKNASYVDKTVAFATKKWAQWEKKDAGWQRKVVDYGNHAFRRIPYEEWGLKSVPPLSARRRMEELRGDQKVQLVFPPSAIPLHKAESVVKTLATEREVLHKKRLVWCVLGMPLTIPVGLLPVYVFRALETRRMTLTRVLGYPTCPSSTSYTARGPIGAPSWAAGTFSGSSRTDSSSRPPRNHWIRCTARRRNRS